MLSSRRNLQDWGMDSLISFHSLPLPHLCGGNQVDYMHDREPDLHGIFSVIVANKLMRKGVSTKVSPRIWKTLSPPKRGFLLVCWHGQNFNNESPQMWEKIYSEWLHSLSKAGRKGKSFIYCLYANYIYLWSCGAWTGVCRVIFFI